MAQIRFRAVLEAQSRDTKPQRWIVSLNPGLVSNSLHDFHRNSTALLRGLRNFTNSGIAAQHVGPIGSAGSKRALSRATLPQCVIHSRLQRLIDRELANHAAVDRQLGWMLEDPLAVGSSKLAPTLSSPEALLDLRARLSAFNRNAGAFTDDGELRLLVQHVEERAAMLPLLAVATRAGRMAQKHALLADACGAMAQKHAEERAAMLPLLAVACMKRYEGARLQKNADARRDLQVFERWMLQAARDPRLEHPQPPGREAMRFFNSTQ
ncbi:hypothetical protein T484DRAFT_1843809, partial [Baffinella frigidus]